MVKQKRKQVQRFWTFKNFVRGGKGFITSFVTALIIFIPLKIFEFLVLEKQAMGLATLVVLTTIYAHFHVWGYFAKRMWGWK